MRSRARFGSMLKQPTGIAMCIIDHSTVCNFVIFVVTRLQVCYCLHSTLTVLNINLLNIMLSTKKQLKVKAIIKKCYKLYTVFSNFKFKIRAIFITQPLLNPAGAWFYYASWIPINDLMFCSSVLWSLEFASSWPSSVISFPYPSISSRSKLNFCCL